MRALAKMLCAAAVALPLGGQAGTALAQSNLDPQLGTHCSRNGLDPCGAGAPWYGGGPQILPQPLYRNPIQLFPQRRHYRHDTSRGSHEEWCYGTYRSYRAWDNTFKPHRGPRQQCRSPYG